jgi:uncharacterized protein (TIGR02145 family)
MLKNLDVDTYSDGTPIPQVTDPTAWEALSTGAWCYYNNDPANGAIYGKLYNWYAVAGIYDAASLTNPALRKKLAPAGFHIPTWDDWTTLENCVNNINPVGYSSGKMKETGTAHWLSPNTGATNSSGFTGLPGGFRYNRGQGEGLTFYNIRDYGFWWSSLEYNTTLAWSRLLISENDIIYRYRNYKHGGFSVRCVKD